jgi:hypothetical protein
LLLDIILCLIKVLCAVLFPKWVGIAVMILVVCLVSSQYGLCVVCGCDCGWVNVELCRARRLRRMVMLRSVRTSFLNVNMLWIFLVDRINSDLNGKRLAVILRPFASTSLGWRHRCPVVVLVWNYLFFFLEV